MSKKQASQKKSEAQPEPRAKIDFSQPIESPLPDYPGTAVFEFPFLPSTFRKWRAAQKARVESGQEDDGDLYCILPDGMVVFDSRLWGEVLAVCKVKLDNLPPDALTDPTGESTPIQVSGWLVTLLLSDYLNDALNLGK